MKAIELSKSFVIPHLVKGTALGKHVFCSCGKEMYSLGMDVDTYTLKKYETFRCECGRSITTLWEWGIV